MMNEEMNGQFKFDLDSEKALVVQGNSFAMARYDMSNMEQKLFCILLSTISQKDEYFVLNDFRQLTTDSREQGAIKKSQIKGKLLFIMRRRNF